VVARPARAAEANIRDYGAALDLVWEAVEQQAVGLLPTPEQVPPYPLERAALLVAAIHKLGGGRRTIPVEALGDIASVCADDRM
jgi:hypothetical protein